MRRKIIAISLLLFFSTLAIAQNAEIQKGDTHFEFFQFKEASEYYEKALKIANHKDEAYLLDRLGQCYKYTFQYKKAEEVFSRLVRLGDGKASPDAYLDYGSILKINGDYGHARDQFKYFLTIFPEDPYATFQLRSLTWAEKNKDSIRDFTIVPTNLNISGQSLGYCFFDDGLMYSTSRSNNPNDNTTQFFDLDYAQIMDSATFVQGDKILDELTFGFNEGSPSVSEDGLLVYFSANATKIKKGGVVKKKVGGIEISADGVSNIKIYVARLSNGKYVGPEELPFNNNEYNCMNPWITDNGNTLFFASDMPKGFGGLDLYKVTRGPDGKWGKPMNLGQHVNTAENEMYPFVSNGNLFYASKGLNGFGGYDLYQSKLTFGIPGAPINMGQPFNSSHDDVAFICKPNGRTGYFSSNRDNGEGIDKVYFFEDNKLYAEANPVLALADNKQKTTPSKPPPASNKAKTYASMTDDELLKLVFEKVHFRFNEVQLTSSANITLDSVIALLQVRKNIKIQMSAHTDSRGSKVYNQLLSEKRAATVKKYLIHKGLPSDRIIANAYGETQLLNSCADGVACTDGQHQENRRVEISIVK
jgi:peptidoglycan-associated lipoprotein